MGRLKFGLLCFGALVSLPVPGWSAEAAASCKHGPDLIGACFKMHAAYDDTSADGFAYVIGKGDHRSFAVVGDPPAALQRWRHLYPHDSLIVGDFEICPHRPTAELEELNKNYLITPAKGVCIEAVTNLQRANVSRVCEALGTCGK